MIYQNPLAKYSCPESANLTKAELFRRDIASDAPMTNPYGTYWTLKGAEIDEVEYIAGLWRLQIDFPHKIQHVRDRYFIIGERLPVHESNKFDYYQAQFIDFNCYGPFMLGDAIVGHFKTARGNFCGYGKNIPEVRSFLASQVFDAYRDVIHVDIAKKSNAR